MIKEMLVYIYLPITHFIVIKSLSGPAQIS